MKDVEISCSVIGAFCIFVQVVVFDFPFVNDPSHHKDRLIDLIHYTPWGIAFYRTVWSGVNLYVNWPDTYCTLLNMCHLNFLTENRIHPHKDKVVCAAQAILTNTMTVSTVLWINIICLVAFYSHIIAVLWCWIRRDSIEIYVLWHTIWLQ